MYLHVLLSIVLPWGAHVIQLDAEILACLCVCFPLSVALQNYHSSSDTEKKQLVATYLEKGGLKNLSWVHQYFESSSSQQIEGVRAQKGMFTAATILGFNGLTVGMNLKENRAETVLQNILQDNWTKHGLDPNDAELQQLNSVCPELNRYFYIHSVQTEDDLQTKKQELHQAVDVKTAGLKAVLDKHTGSGVKLENPGFTELKGKQTVLQSGKNKAERELGSVKDLLAELEKKSQDNKGGFDSILKEGKQHIHSADDFLGTCREALAAINSMSIETDAKDVDNQLEATNNLVQMGMIHVEGLKGFKARLKVLLK